MKSKIGFPNVPPAATWSRRNITTYENPPAGGSANGVSETVLAAMQNNPKYNTPKANFQRLGDVTAQVVAQIRVHLNADGSFDYGPDGVLASILPVRGIDGRMEDIVAWGDDPTRWWRRRRLGILLGMESVERADYLQEPLTLFETPADWVAGGKSGAVVLDWTACLDMYLPLNTKIECESERLARRLRYALCLSPPLVTVKVRR